MIKSLIGLAEEIWLSLPYRKCRTGGNPAKFLKGPREECEWFSWPL
jgi:hypothetical protein